jgi:tetratricopeptide (TPR) repeat protein
VRAERLTERPLAASPRSSVAHFAKGQVLRAQDPYAAAIPEYQTVIALNRNWANAYTHLGWCKFMTGSLDELIPAQEQAIRLSPRDPQIGLFYSRIGRAHLLQSRTGEAVIWCEKARNATPAAAIFRSSSPLAMLSMETGRAAAELAEARRLVGDDRYSSIARLGAIDSWGVATIRALVEATCLPVSARPESRTSEVGAVAADDNTAARSRSAGRREQRLIRLPLAKGARNLLVQRL